MADAVRGIDRKLDELERKFESTAQGLDHKIESTAQGLDRKVEITARDLKIRGAGGVGLIVSLMIALKVFG